MHVGVTATRVGASLTQREFLRAWLELIFESSPRRDSVWFHHGDCEGGDEQAHDIAELIGYKIHVHPPDDPKARVFKIGDRESKPMPYLERNKDIVISTNILFVLPETFIEKLRSGTWSTYRFAQKIGKPYVIIFPDGRTDFGNGARGLLSGLGHRKKRAKRG